MALPPNAPDGPLHFSDVECFLMPPNTSNPEILPDLIQFAKQMMEFRVYRINTHYKEYQKAWPEGTLIDFFHALRLVHDKHQKLPKLLQQTDFRESVLREKSHYKNINKSDQPAANVRYETPQHTPQIDISPDDIRARKNLSSTPQIDLSKWSKKNIDTFVKLVREQFSNEEIGTKFRITEDQVLDVKEQLTKRGFFNKNKQTKRSKRKDEGDDKITGFTFIKKERSFRCGKILFDNYDPDLNPLKGYVDEFSGKPIKRPMICQHGYVLDYDTWYNIIYGNNISNHQHPYTGERLGSMTALTQLTVENFDQYKDHIINLKNLKVDP